MDVCFPEGSVLDPSQYMTCIVQLFDVVPRHGLYMYEVDTWYDSIHNIRKIKIELLLVKQRIK